MLEPGSGWEGPPLCLALNKCDNLDSQSVDSLLQEIRASSRAANVLPISAKASLCSGRPPTQSQGKSLAGSS